MASVGQCSIGACLGLKKNINAFPIVQSGNARYFSHLSTNQQKSNSTFSQISLRGKKNLNVSKRSKEDIWRIRCTNDGSCGIVPVRPPSVLELVQKFYNAMNSKSTDELNQILKEIISDECVFQDLIFYLPFGGKQSIISFLGTVKDAMGPNVRVVPGNVLEGENLTASVIWHLEWQYNHKTYEIPFTTGYNFFDCELQDDGKLYIRKINGVEELPVKPGDLVLKLFKAISTMFDSFPLAAVGLLQKSQNSHEGLLGLLDMLGKYKKQ